MKKLISFIMIAALVIAMVILPGVALADSGEAGIAGTALLIECAARIASTLLITLIGVLGAWLTLKLGKHTELENINTAQLEVIRAAKTTVGELQQTVVDRLKASHADGKLTKQEIVELGDMLIDKTVQKLSMPTYKLLEAAAVDVNALISGVGENWINKLKNGKQNE